MQFVTRVGSGSVVWHRAKYFIINFGEPSSVYRLKSKDHNLEILLSGGWIASCSNQLTGLKHITSAQAKMIISKIKREAQDAQQSFAKTKSCIRITP